MIISTDRARRFKDVAKAVIGHHQRGQIENIAFREHIKGRYQSYTQADMRALHQAGYSALFLSVEQGLQPYMNRLDKNYKCEER